MKTILLCLFLAVMTIGCATDKPYNPVAAASDQVFLLNKSSFAQLKNGMTRSQVHEIMGDSIEIGYVYQKAAGQDTASYKPLTIANPYKTQEISTTNGPFTVEYYVSHINQSDGIVSDDELVPVLFQDDHLVARGWDSLKALQLKTSS